MTDHQLSMLNSHAHHAAANMYPWYRDSMSQLGQFCGQNPAALSSAAAAAAIKTENGYNDCMLALDYAHNKVGVKWLKRRSFLVSHWHPPTYDSGSYQLNKD